MSTQFAIDTAGRIIHISEAERGLSCNCFCVVCGERMVAKKGPEREHHFAHESNKQDCSASHESLLHRFAKRVIQEKGGLAVPPTSGQTSPRWLMFDRVEEERRLGTITPDLIGYSGNIPVLIEVAYSSFAGAEKIAKLKAFELQAIEIDVHHLHPENFDPEIARTSILDDTTNKKWLFAPDEPRKPSYTEEKVVIQGIWVFLRYLPYGDLAIRVPAFNPAVNAIVKAIAKRYWGRWNPRYKNWIVPQRWAQRAADNIRAAANSLDATA